MQKENSFVLSNNYYSKRINISSILNLVTDALQRTCTGTIVIDLDGSGWVTETNTKDNTSGGVTDGTPKDVNTNGVDVTTTDEYVITGDKNNLQRNPFDNVHFGPAGIGLLIMGFLVLGCKYFNIPIYMCHPKKIWRGDKFSDFLINYV